MIHDILEHRLFYHLKKFGNFQLGCKINGEIISACLACEGGESALICSSIGVDYCPQLLSIRYKE